jgi:hypothetical protein
MDVSESPAPDTPSWHRARPPHGSRPGAAVWYDGRRWILRGTDHDTPYHADGFAPSHLPALRSAVGASPRNRPEQHKDERVPTPENHTPERKQQRLPPQSAYTQEHHGPHPEHDPKPSQHHDGPKTP